MTSSMHIARLCLSLLVLVSSSILAAENPNIVLILCDDLGINDLSCYGRKDHHTPNLDRLASEGIRFTTAYCAQPICSPSRAALMTGKSPARLHLTNFLPGRADAPSQKLRQPVIEGQLPLEEVTIAERLNEAGYATGHIGKWHLGNDELFGPQKQGFDSSFSNKPNSLPTETEGSKGEYELTARAEQWLEEHKEQAFFLYLAHNTPHIPFSALEVDATRHKDAFNPAYAAVIEHLDRCVGRLMAKIDALGLRERTIFIFTSDNGGLHVLESPGTPATHNSPFRAGKGFLYEGGLRVPLIIRWPGTVAPGSVTATPIILTDLVPTLLEVAGIDVTKQVGPLDGVSLLELLRGKDLAPRPLFWHFPNYTNQGGLPSGAVRDGDWKLVEYFEDGRTELFDLSKDVAETSDLAAKESTRVTDLKRKLADWRVSVGAQGLKANPAYDPAKHDALYAAADPSKLTGTNTAAEIAKEWTPWRVLMNAMVKGSRAIVTPAQGDVRLLAKDAKVHGTKLRYEPQPQKNTLGFWTQPDDWASWDFEVPAAGHYEVEVLQGCGNAGGAEVAVEVGGKTIGFTVVGTGHFQNFIQRTIGIVELAAGKQTLAVKPQTKPGNAVMDLRRVVLRPVPLVQ